MVRICPDRSPGSDDRLASVIARHYDDTRLLSPRRFDYAETGIRCPDVRYGTNGIHTRVD